MQGHCIFAESFSSHASQHKGSVTHPIATHAKVTVTYLSGLLRSNHGLLLMPVIHLLRENEIPSKRVVNFSNGVQLNCLLQLLTIS